MAFGNACEPGFEGCVIQSSCPRWRCSRLDAAARVLRVETEGFTKKQIAGFRDLLQTVRAIREDIKALYPFQQYDLSLVRL
jgi:hypothetical protein